MLLSLACCLSAFIGKAERTKGITRVYFKPNSDVSFVLFDNVPIDCGDIEGKWQSMVIYLPSTKDYFTGVKKMRKGDPLFDSTGRKIGYIASDKIDLMPQGSTVDHSFDIRLAGYIVDSNIDVASVPERQLEQLILSNKNSLTYANCARFMAEFRFERHEKHKDEIEEANPQLRSYEYYFDSYIGGPTIIRLQFLFHNNDLVAIFHGRSFRKMGYKDIRLGHNNLLWLKNETDPGLQQLLHSYKWLHEGSGTG
jgi:hypothetical protein